MLFTKNNATINRGHADQTGEMARPYLGLILPIMGGMIVHNEHRYCIHLCHKMCNVQSRGEKPSKQHIVQRREGLKCCWALGGCEKRLSYTCWSKDSTHELHSENQVGTTGC